MKKSEQIIKSLVLPVLEKDNNFNQLNLNDDFWKAFTSGILLYENDAKPVFKAVYELQLNDSEKVIAKLTLIHTNFIKELAELYVLGGSDDAIDILKANNDKQFLEQVNYFKTVKGVITKLERESIKEELPKAYEKVTFEIPENDLEAIIKKNERENLKKKFKQWDEELETKKSSYVMYSLGKDEKIRKPKVINLSWIKYAIAACVVFAIGFWMYDYNSMDVIPSDGNVVNTKIDTTPGTKTDIIEKPIEAIAYDTKEIKSYVQYPTELGYTNTSNNNAVTITIKDGSKNIEELEKLLAIEISNSKGSGSRVKTIQNQLKLLKMQLGKYEFDGKIVTIYSSDLKAKYTILSENSKEYYIKKNENYFYLYFSKLPLDFVKIKDSELIVKLEKTSFENE